MPFKPDFKRIIDEAFKRYGVDHPQLQNALVEILDRSIDYRYIAERVTEEQQKTERRARRARGE